MAGLYKEITNLKIPVEGLKLGDYRIIGKTLEEHSIYHIYKSNNNNMGLTHSNLIISVTELGSQGRMHRERFFEEIKQIKALIEDYNSYMDYF